MLTKYGYRSYFAYVSKFLKMSWFLDELGINRGNFYRFLSSEEYDSKMSPENLKALYELIHVTCKNVA